MLPAPTNPATVNSCYLRNFPNLETNFLKLETLYLPVSLMFLGKHFFNVGNELILFPKLEITSNPKCQRKAGNGVSEGGKLKT